MMTSSYIFLSSWWGMLKVLDRETRDELVCAINAYVFEDVEPTLSPLATGYFAAIRMDLDKVKNRSEDISRKRSEAGIKGNLKRWGSKSKGIANIANIANAICESQISQNIANGTNAIFDKETNEKEKNQKKEDKKETDFTTIITRAKDEYLSWIADDSERLKLLLFRNGLIGQDTEQNGLKEAIKPYVDEFVEWEYTKGADLYLKSKSDVLHHFSLWLPSYLKTKQNNDNSGHHKPLVATGSTLPEYTYNFNQ